MTFNEKKIQQVLLTYESNFLFFSKNKVNT